MSNLSDLPDNQSSVVEANTLAILNRSEIESQIATAHRYPRSLANFRREGLAMVTLSPEIAESCVYALPRGDKTLEGPSVRFAEVIQSAWGNCRSGARVVNEQETYLTAQGAFLDLERNAGITYDVQRRIVDSKGYHYSVDMVGVTANAACSIAHRNAILKGIPKALWGTIYEAARASVMGDFKTLGNRRAEAIKKFQAHGVTKEMLCSLLNINGVQDIVIEHLVTLHGVLTAIQDGDSTVEEVFAPKTPKEEGPQTNAAPKKRKATGPDLNAALDDQPTGTAKNASSTSDPNTVAQAKPENAVADNDGKQPVPNVETPEFIEAKSFEAADNATSIDRLDQLELDARNSLDGERLQRVIENIALCRAALKTHGNPLPKGAGPANGLFDD